MMTNEVIAAIAGASIGGLCTITVEIIKARRRAGSADPSSGISVLALFASIGAALISGAALFFILGWIGPVWHPPAALAKDPETKPTELKELIRQIVVNGPTKVTYHKKSKALTVEGAPPEGFYMLMQFPEGRLLGTEWSKGKMPMMELYNTKPISVRWFWRNPTTRVEVHSPQQKTIEETDD